MNSASGKLWAGDIRGCAGIRSREAQSLLNSGTEAALAELLRDQSRVTTVLMVG